MYTEPPTLDRTLLADTLKNGWGIAAGDLAYVPVGFGTHHYRTGRWWINVDVPGDTAKLERALRTVVALAAQGLEFVHAPTPGAGGHCVAAMPGGYAVSVFGLIEGESYEFGDFPDQRLRLDVLHALGRLHTAPTAAHPDTGPDTGIDADTLAVPHRDTVLKHLDGPWTGGPHGQEAHELVSTARDHIQALLDRFDDLQPRVEATRDRWVITHGEPHPGNVMRTSHGIKLIDWDTVRLAPPERDLWMINPRGPGEWAAYGTAEVDTAALELYRRWWELSEICDYTATLRGPHTDNADTRIAIRELRTYLGSPDQDR